MPSSDAFDSLVGAIDYPMFIVTASNGDERAGCLVGFATQASIDPARMMVMISKKNHTYRVASFADRLVIHFLGAGNLELARLFGEQTGDEVDKFSCCEWTPTADGSPVLHGTLGWVACRVLDRFDAGDHVGHLVEPVYGEATGDARQLGFQMVTSLQPGHTA
ncbi:MAG TPA: flavin reductase family protein [Acidimicrobiales bacterium]|nr:flavin reductase family protein [Acidimicrobiales bacterium]